MFNQRLIELRKTKKLTQTELANKLGFTRGQISNYELGQREPDYKTLNKLADFFNVSADYLLGRTNDPHPQRSTEIVKAEIDEIINNPNIEAHWNGKPLTTKQREIALDILKAVLERLDSDKK